jgi:hypothetical protein
LPAVLSLTIIAASQISANVRLPSPTRALVVGEFTTRSEASKGIRCSRLSWPASTRLRIAAAANSLNVLHIGNSSVERWPLLAPVATSNTATPSRPPLAFSRFANTADRPAQASSDRALEVLGIKPTDALTNSARQQNILRLNIIGPYGLLHR